MPLLSIIVPVFNEGKIIAQSLPPILNLNINKEVIVVNDGSSDNSFLELEKFGNHPDFRLINLEKNRGKGHAIRTALQNINGQYFTICDADLEYNPEEILNLLALAQEHPSPVAVYGSRFLHKKNYTFHYTVNAFLTTMTNVLFKAKLTDMETCFKLIPAEAVAKINLTANRFEIEPQITAQLLKNGYPIKELAISYDRRGYKEGKKIKPRDGWLAVKMLLAERFKKS